MAALLAALLLIIGVTVAVPAASSGSSHSPPSPFLDSGWEDADDIEDQLEDHPGSMYWVAQEITGAAEYWNDGYTGDGVDVALIDTGVVEVNGLKGGKVVNGPDLSFEALAPNLRFKDTYGHGTHMAGIIAGRDNGAEIEKGEDEDFLGMAPEARIVNVKVADANGIADVSQVIAAINWVVRHRNSHGLNIRVLNLSFGTDGDQAYTSDPLAHAVEKAWEAGIVVVVAGGNDGNAAPLRNPAINPYVIAVGAAEGNQTYDAADDTIPEFSNCGTSSRHVDLVAPGKSIVSLRTPGSNADQNHPKARVGNRFFLGSGSSQAAAVVSGGAALVIEQRPGITPDEVKALLMETAQELSSASTLCQGAGMIDLKEARGTTTPTANQTWASSTGGGTLDGARGSYKVDLGGVTLTGDQDIFGAAWDGLSWSMTTPSSASTDGWTWGGLSWSGLSWSGLSWSGLSWSGLSWSGLSWSGLSWSSNSWNGLSWSGLSWSGLSWSGLSWSSAVWATADWATTEPEEGAPR